MDLDNLKSHLLEEVCDRIGQYNLTDEEKQRVIDDYIFLSFLWVMILLHILLQ